MMETATASKINSFSVTEDGENCSIEVFALNLRGTTVQLCSFGATIIKFLSKKKDDTDVVDIVAGYNDPKTFHDTGNPNFFGGIVGRVANRIAGGNFALGKKSYSICVNDPPNSLHGGKVSFSQKIWNAKIIRNGSAVRFLLRSPDGDEGFPGGVVITATYSLRPSFSSTGVVLQLDMSAELDQSTASKKGETFSGTPINLANHSYFNLGDRQNGILDHTLRLESDSYAPVDEHSIPTREIRMVDEDPEMDFRFDRSLRDALKLYGVARLGFSEEESTNNLEVRNCCSLETPYGIDHNYVVRKQPGISLPLVGALAFGTRNLLVYSDAPGVQIYTSNHLGKSEKLSSAKNFKRAYRPWEAICLETQYFPDSICSEEDVPKSNQKFWAGRCPILSRSQPTYHHTMLLRLEVDQYASAFRGSDTEGRKYSSIEEMWNAQDLSTWYSRAKGWYEDNCDATIDGVLGGIGHISGRDLEGSRAFLKKLDLPQMKPILACECGAGIGRVTKGLLLDFADRCDLVESSSRLLFSAPEYIGDEQSHRCRFFCTELQEWIPRKNRYAIIWIQWTLCYLTDFDIVRFLRRCADSLIDGGWILLKENTCNEEAFVVDVDDSSITRSLEYWLDLVGKSGLQVKRLEWQDDFPDDIFPVPIIALQK